MQVTLLWTDACLQVHSMQTEGSREVSECLLRGDTFNIVYDPGRGNQEGCQTACFYLYHVFPSVCDISLLMKVKLILAPLWLNGY